MCWNFIFTPIIVYTGFGRVAMLYERKFSLIQISQAQELLLHTLPLGLIVFYNNKDFFDSSQTLDKIIMIFVVFSTVQMLSEVIINKLYTNAGTALERKTSAKS